MPPSGEPIAVKFAADHEGTSVLSEYGSSSIFEKEGVPQGSLTKYSPGYGSKTALKAETTAANAYARGQAIKAQTGWKAGQLAYFSQAILLLPGFYEKRQGQVDFGRWDNFEQKEVETERGGFVIQSTEKKIRLVRIKDPAEQHAFNLEGEKVLGPEIQEGRWYHLEAMQILWPVDGEALNKLWINGNLVATSTDRNCGREDLIVSRHRAGVVGTSNAQTNPISVAVDRVRCGPTRAYPLRRGTLLSRRQRVVNP